MRLVRWTKPVGSDVDKPAISAVRIRHSIIWVIYDDGDAVDSGAQIMPPESRQAVIPRRTDLDTSHPLYNRRVIGTVPAGCPDIELDSDGNLATLLGG